MRGLTGAIALLAILCAASVAGETVILAPGYSELEYDPPAPGSYQLPPLGEAVDGKVVDMNGKATTLHEVMDDRLVLMNAKYAQIWPNITRKGEAPADAEEWNGKPDKLKLLSEKPGQQ